MDVPKLGDTVHYVSEGSPVQEDGTQIYPSQCRAAIVTGDRFTKKGEEFLPSPNLSLAVINPTGLHFRDWVTHHPERGAERHGTWHTREECH